MNSTQTGEKPSHEVESVSSSGQSAVPRLALFIDSLSGGGAERVILTLAGSLAGRGIPIDLVVVRAQGALAGQIPKGVRLVDLEASRTIAALPGLVRYLRRWKPAALLSALSHVNCIALAARAIANSDTRVVVSEHVVVTIASASARRLRERATPLAMRIAYRWADAIVAVSTGVAEDLARMLGRSPGRIRVICNPIFSPALLASAAEPLNHAWFEGRTLPVILAAGRLAPEKDFRTLLRAFALLRRRVDARLIILGEGTERRNLEGLAQELGIFAQVSLPGFVANPYQYMRRASIFVLSSIFEGFGNVLVEAMACGTPVVSTDCPSGPAEILEGGKWGRLVPMRNPEALADAMAQALARPGRDALQRAQDFSVDTIAAQYLELLLPGGSVSAEVRGVRR